MEVLLSKIKVRLNPDTPPTGSDLSVCNAARRSFNTRSDWEYSQGGTGPVKLKDKDKRLIEFLARGMTADDFEQFKLDAGGKGLDWLYYMDNNKEQELIDLLWQWRNTPTHDTPFNHTFISFEVKAPIFVRAQLVKHEYLIMSEFSRRYITDGIEFYEPDYWRKAAPNKKQGSLEEEIDQPEFNPNNLNSKLKHLYLTAVQDYGVAPEQARMVLPQSTMTEWTWSGTLGAFAKMCQLRLHPEAQYEARLVAQEVYKHLKAQWPVSAPALVEGVL
jgi:thymidylate synthase (FAD)